MGTGRTEGQTEGTLTDRTQGKGGQQTQTSGVRPGGSQGVDGDSMISIHCEPRLRWCTSLGICGQQRLVDVPRSALASLRRLGNTGGWVADLWFGRF